MAAIYEIGHDGINIIGYDQGINFYDPDRNLQCAVYLGDDDELYFCGTPIGGTSGGTLSEADANAIYLRLDCSNDPLTNNLAIEGNVNLNKANAQLQIEGDLGLKMEDTAGARSNVIMGINADACETRGDAELADAVIIGKYIGNGFATYQGDERYGNLSRSVVIGSEAVYSPTGDGLYYSADPCVVIGYRAVYESGTALQSVVIGPYASASSTYKSGTSWSVVIGYEAAYNTNYGDYAWSPRESVVIGYQAAKETFWVESEVIIGAYAGMRESVADGPSFNSCVMIGHFAGGDVDWASVCVGVGEYAHAYTQGSDNVAVGWFALCAYDETVTHEYNTAVGAGALDGPRFDVETTYEGNTGIGAYAGTHNYDSQRSVYLGAYAGSSPGVGVSYNHPTCVDSVMIGYSAVYNILEDIRSSVVNGYQAAYLAYSIDTSVMIGYRVGYQSANGIDGAVLVGHNVAYEAEILNSVIIGTDAVGAALAIASGDHVDDCVIIGHDACYDLQVGKIQTSVVIGSYAGYSADDVQTSVIIGNDAGYYAQEAYYNVVIGKNAGQDLDGTAAASDAEGNVLIGADAGRNATVAFGLVAVGYDAMGNGIVTGDYNIAVGNNAGYALTSGEQNVLIGAFAGYSLTTESSNVFIGYRAGQNATASNRLYIANSNTATPLIYGEFDNSLVRVHGQLEVTEGLTLQELSVDPANPDEGHAVMWMSDGTGTGDDGDILVKITAGGSTRTFTLIDFSDSTSGTSEIRIGLSPASGAVTPHGTDLRHAITTGPATVAATAPALFAKLDQSVALSPATATASTPSTYANHPRAIELLGLHAAGQHMVVQRDGIKRIPAQNVNLVGQAEQSSIDTTYGYHTSIGIPPGSVTADETDFPVVLTVTDSRFATAANGGHVQNTDSSGGASGSVTVPADFVVCTDPADPDGTKVDFEFTDYNPATGYMELWVEVPALSSTLRTPIYFVYGNPTVTTSQENVAGTWSSKHAAVYHMGDAGETVYDSTGNDYHMTVEDAAPTYEQPGKIGKGITFDQSAGYPDYQWVRIHTQVVADYPVAMAVWANFDDADGDYSGCTSIADGHHYARVIRLGGSGDEAGDPVTAGNYGTEAQTTAGFTAETWHYLTGVWASPTDRRALIDVSNKGTDTTSNDGHTAWDQTSIGSDAESNNYGRVNGTLDEAMFYDVSQFAGATDAEKADRYEEWAATAYANQSDPTAGGSFWSALGEENAPVVVAATADASATTPQAAVA